MPMPTNAPSSQVVQDDDAGLDEPRQRGGRANEIRNLLQEEIESGSLPPGTPLDERALATRFQVSRTPVREVLQQLAARDLVRIAPRQGVSVARLSVNQVRAMMETVGELESLVAKLAARRVDDALRAALDTALRRCHECAAQGGAASATWRVQKQEDFPKEQRVAFDWPGTGEWQETKFTIDAPSRVIHLRIYPPRGARALAVQSISLSREGQPPQTWRFDGAK